MGRQARSAVAGEPHHVMQHGNRREGVFFDDADRRKYLSLVRKYCLRKRGPKPKTNAPGGAQAEKEFGSLSL